jgi:hypothetical protein
MKPDRAARDAGRWAHRRSEEKESSDTGQGLLKHTTRTVSTSGKEDGGAETRSHRTTTDGQLHGVGRIWIKGRKDVWNVERGQRIFLEREVLFLWYYELIECTFITFLILKEQRANLWLLVLLRSLKHWSSMSSKPINHVFSLLSFNDYFSSNT